MLCLKSNYALPEIFKVFSLLLPHSCRSYGPRKFSRMPWNFAQKEYQVSEKSQTSNLFKNRIRWNFLTLNFLFSNHEKLSPAFFEVSFAKNSSWRLQLENAREPSALNIMFEDCGRSEIQHLTSSVKSLVKCYIYYVMTVQFFHQLERFVEVCACAWDYFCFVYSAEECIKDREVVPTDLINKVKMTFQSHYCFWDLSSISLHGTFGKKSCSSPLHCNHLMLWEFIFKDTTY